MPIIGAAVLLSACATSRTTIESSWADGDYSGPPLDRIAIVALFEQDFLVAETALFENRSDRLLWTAKSETLDDARLRRTSESIVRTVARRLIAMDLIARMTAASGPARALNKDDGLLEPRSRGRDRA